MLSLERAGETGGRSASSVAFVSNIQEIDYRQFFYGNVQRLTACNRILCHTTFQVSVFKLRLSRACKEGFSVSGQVVRREIQFKQKENRGKEGKYLGRVSGCRQTRHRLWFPYTSSRPLFAAL